MAFPRACSLVHFTVVNLARAFHVGVVLAGLRSPLAGALQRRRHAGATKREREKRV